MKVILRDTLTTYMRGLIQYDYGQFLQVFNTGLEENYMNFQFVKNGEEIDQLAELNVDEGFYKVKVPDKFLKTEGEIVCFIYYEDEEKGQTEKILILDVLDREMYDVITDEEDEHLLAEVLAKLNDFSLDEETMAQIESDLKEQVLNDYYNKTEIDTKIDFINKKIDDANAVLETI